MVAAGKTQREIAAHFGLKDKYIVKQLLARERRKKAKINAGIMPRLKGRSPKGYATKSYRCRASL